MHLCKIALVCRQSLGGQLLQHMVQHEVHAACCDRTMAVQPPEQVTC